MTISIFHKLKPFTHQKGQKFLIPGSSICFKVFPCKIVGYDLLTEKEIFDLELDLALFFKDFTAEVDFERRFLRIFGKAEEGFIELKIYKKQSTLYLHLQRFQESKLHVVLNGTKKALKVKESLELAEDPIFEIPVHEKLFLGVSKKQELDRMNQDKDIKEYLPYLFELGSSLGLKKSENLQGIFKLIEAMNEETETAKIKQLELLIYGFFKEGFVPFLDDRFHLGLHDLTVTKENPLLLLKKIYEFLKSALLEKTGHELKIFSSFPRHFVAGKATGLEFEYGKVHLEWTKGFLRQVVLNIQKPCKLDLIFPKSVKRFRVRKGKKVIKLSQELESGIYHIDNFHA